MMSSTDGGARRAPPGSGGAVPASPGALATAGSFEAPVPFLDVEALKIRKRPRFRYCDGGALAVMLLFAILAVLLVDFFAGAPSRDNIYQVLNIKPRPGENQFDSMALQEYIDHRRQEIAGQKGQGNPVGRYVDPACDRSALIPATYADFCFDELQYDAQFATIMLSLMNAGRAITMAGPAMLSVFVCMWMCIVGRQRCFNEAVEVEREMLKIRSLMQNTSGPQTVASEQSFAQLPSGTVTMRDAYGAMLSALALRKAAIPPIELVVYGTNLQTIIITCWLTAGLTAGMMSLFLFISHLQLTGFLADETIQEIPELQEYWSGFNSRLRFHIGFAAVLLVLPYLLVVLDVVVFLIGVIPYNLYRMRKKKAVEEEIAKTNTATKSSYFTGPAAASRAAADAKNSSTRSTFGYIEDLAFADRVDVFFMEWRLFSRMLIAPRLWVWLTGSSREFISFDCLSCNKMDPAPRAAAGPRRTGSLNQMRLPPSISTPTAGSHPVGRVATPRTPGGAGMPVSPRGGKVPSVSFPLEAAESRSTNATSQSGSSAATAGRSGAPTGQQPPPPPPAPTPSKGLTVDVAEAAAAPEDGLNDGSQSSQGSRGDPARAKLAASLSPIKRKAKPKLSITPPPDPAGDSPASGRSASVSPGDIALNPSIPDVPATLQPPGGSGAGSPTEKDPPSKLGAEQELAVAEAHVNITVADDDEVPPSASAEGTEGNCAERVDES